MNTLKSVNPTTGETTQEFPQHSDAVIDAILGQAIAAQSDWKKRCLTERCELFTRLAEVLNSNHEELGRLITLEMGKPRAEAEAEVKKCAQACNFYVENAADYLSQRDYSSPDAVRYVRKRPLGVLLAIMPWNYPLWQVFRCAIPGLLAGNALVLKHASNVSMCSLAIEKSFREAGFPDGLMASLLVAGSRAEAVVRDDRIASLSLTGSEAAGAKAAAAAGSTIKKSILELGGSDPFVVLDDADLERSAEIAIKSRFQNAGQSCIAAKRFIVTERVADEFRTRLANFVAELRVGDPQNDVDLGPLAKKDILNDIVDQERRALKEGARLVAKSDAYATDRGFFYAPKLMEVKSCDSVLMQEEIFGPLAPILVVENAEEAIRAANNTRFGLGASLWTRDLELAEKLALEINAGQVFINGMVASDPGLPFGGVKKSGYGRELADLGLFELTNLQSVWIAPNR